MTLKWALYALFILGEAPTMPNSSLSKPSAMDRVFFGEFR